MGGRWVRGRRWWAVLAAAVLVMLQAGPALAPHVAQLQVTPSQVRPGESVTVFGPRGYGATNPVEIRLDSATGPVLGLFQPDQNRFAQWGPGTVTIPEDTRPGTHVLWATQELPEADSHIRGVPARAVIEVSGPAGTPLVGAPRTPIEQGRPETLATSTDGASLGAVLLVGLGTAGLVLLIAGTVAVTVGRRSGSATPARVPGTSTR